MNMKSIVNPAWLLAAALVVPVGYAHADEIKTVTVEGEAAIVEGDAAQTERAVKRDARRKAVEQGAGVSVSSNTIVRNYQMIADEIATTAKGVISDEQWGPLTDGDTKTTKKIKLTAKVSKEAFEDGVCTVLKANHDPKITLVFVEKVGDEAKWNTERGFIESLFTSAFKDNCFTIVESGVKVTEVSANGDMSQDVIQQIVKNTDAQYVLLGSAKLLKADKGGLIEGTKMNSYAVSTNVRLVNTQNNEIEAVVAKSESILGINPENALKSMQKSHNGKGIVEDTVDEMFKKIAARWSADLVNASRVQVIAKGANFQQCKAIKDAIEKNVSGAKAELRSCANGQGSYDVNVDGGSEAFASALDGKKTAKGPIEILEVSHGKVVLQIK